MAWKQIDQWMRRFLVAALFLFVLWKLLSIILPWAAPFLAALLLACLLEYPVRFLIQRFRAPRWAASMLCTLLLALALTGAGCLALWRIIQELSQLSAQLPALIAKLPVSDGRMEAWLYRVTMAAPAQYQQMIAQLPHRLAEGLSSLLSTGSEYVLSLTPRLISSIPSIMLFCFTAILSTYFSSASLPQLTHWLKKLIPPQWHAALHTGKLEALRVLSGWLRAQFVLLSVTFACLVLGLLLLKIDLALLLAVLITLVDALPIFGSGTVLVPWAVFSLLAGETVQGVGLLALFAAISFLRSLLEPKLLGKHMGLHPLASLAALYVGFSAWGVAGLLLAPPTAVLASNLWRGLLPGQKGAVKKDSEEKIV